MWGEGGEKGRKEGGRTEMLAAKMPCLGSITTGAVLEMFAVMTSTLGALQQHQQTSYRRHEKKRKRPLANLLFFLYLEILQGDFLSPGPRM